MKCPACQVRDSLVERAREMRHGMPAAVETAFLVGVALALLATSKGRRGRRKLEWCTAHTTALVDASAMTEEIFGP